MFVPLPVVGRRGTCFYSHKHRLLGGRLTDDVSHRTEITREMPRADVITVLQHSELFYAYEDTFLIMESVLCGCPAVLVPSDTFKECHTLEDFGSNGIACSNDPKLVRIAQATV